MAQLIEQAGCQLLYLPPYSPEFNKIERCWSWLKRRICKQLNQFYCLRDAMEHVLYLASSLTWLLLYLHGVVEPLTGASFFWEFTHLKGTQGGRLLYRLGSCIGVFLDQLAQAFPDSLNLLQLDSGSFHKAQQLEWPDNIIPIFQSPRSPQLNPIERLWQHLKRQLSWQNFESLEQLRQQLGELLDELALELIQSLCGWEFIISALSRASL